MTVRSSLVLATLSCCLAFPVRAHAQGATSEAPTKPQKNDAELATEPTPEQKAELDLLTFYKDNYLLTGFTAARQVKFQFSAKFDMWPNRTPHAVHFGFSQKSLWNLWSTSQPFVESNYAPELFYSYYHAPGRYDPDPGCGFFMERLGFIHESNGEKDALSRGWNRVYGESRFACYDAAHRYVAATVQAWLPAGQRDNSDIYRYLGYGELSLAVGSDRGEGWLGDWELTGRFRKGTRSLGAGSVEVDGRWRPRYGDWWRFTPYLYAQFFTGYGETLLSYDRSLTAVRVGVGFTDRSTRAE